jgi:hypothetical protein
MNKLLYLFLIFLCIFTISCKVEDPFVDRVVAPVLVIFEDAIGKTSGLTTEPSIVTSASTDAIISARLLELNKAGILNNKVGIDSIPVKSLTVTYRLRGGAKISEVVTDDKGRSVLKVSWKNLGIVSPVVGSSVLLSCSATYKEISFTKNFRLTAIK